jgi:hypothetical protein
MRERADRGAVKAVAEVPVARPFDGPRAHTGIENLLRAWTAVRDQ